MKLNTKVFKVVLLLLAVMPFADLRVHRKIPTLSRVFSKTDFSEDIRILAKIEDKEAYYYFKQGFEEITPDKELKRSTAAYFSNNPVGHAIPNVTSDKKLCNTFFYLLKNEYKGKVNASLVPLNKDDCDNFTQNVVGALQQYMVLLISFFKIPLTITADEINNLGTKLTDLEDIHLFSTIFECLKIIYEYENRKKEVYENFGAILATLIRIAEHNLSTENTKKRRHFK